MPGVEAKAVGAAPGQNKGLIGNKDNPAAGEVKETVFKEMVITGETKRIPITLHLLPV